MIGTLRALRIVARVSILSIATLCALSFTAGFAAWVLITASAIAIELTVASRGHCTVHRQSGKSSVRVLWLTLVAAVAAFALSRPVTDNGAEPFRFPPKYLANLATLETLP